MPTTTAPINRQVNSFLTKDNVLLTYPSLVDFYSISLKRRYMKDKMEKRTRTCKRTIISMHYSSVSLSIISMTSLLTKSRKRREKKMTLATYFYFSPSII